MLISQVQEDIEKPKKRDLNLVRNSVEYQTADDLFNIMSKNRDYELTKDKSLSTQDLVILYENIDIGTKLMNTANKTSNQYVETIVYNDDLESEGSDVSDIYSKDDLRDVCMVNNERLDLLNNIPSFDNTICHKLGNIKLKPSNLITEYDTHFLFKDPYIRDQLKQMDIIPGSSEINTSMIPTSLLDYICCKRLEDNYNFYMENIIKYVQHTIEQLKRISNGDYLTNRAKEKWQEVNGCSAEDDNKKMVLANTSSIPLYVEGPKCVHMNSWDDMHHSEMDVTSLTKLLEKKIIIEIPKFICGSYKLFRKHYNESVIINCRTNKTPHSSNDKIGKDKANIVIEIKKSSSNHTVNDVSSIVILKALSAPLEQVPCLSYEQIEHPTIKPNVRIVELDENISESKDDFTSSPEVIFDKNEKSSDECSAESKEVFTNSSEAIYDRAEKSSDDYSDSLKIVSKSNTLNTYTTKNIHKQTEANYSFFTPDELCYTVQRLNMQSPVSEELEEMSINVRKPSPKLRIKSPYENKSFLIEEKKRKKLLEIRDRRERRKIAMTENRKVTKHKYGKGAEPQASDSVTKLSITNKSFYNSIYGRQLSVDDKNIKKSKLLKCKNPSSTTENLDSDSLPTSEINGGTSFYLDNADNEMTYMQFKQDTDDEAAKNITSATNIFNEHKNTSVTELSNVTDSSSFLQNIGFGSNNFLDKLEEEKHVMFSKNVENIVPTNTPKQISTKVQVDPTTKRKTSVECKKSIDEVYNLMKQLGKSDESRYCKPKPKSPNKINVHLGGHSTIKLNDNGPNKKKQLLTSSTSSSSVQKTCNITTTPKKSPTKKTEASVAVIPKVIISTKLQTVKFDSSNNKKETKQTENKMTDNPLKAITQLLHKFDDVQRSRNKVSNEKVPKKRCNHPNQEKTARLRQYNSLKGVRNEQTCKEPESIQSRKTSRDSSQRLYSPTKNRTKSPRLNYLSEGKAVDKLHKNKLSDFIDEVKEYKGEAVRGPKQIRLNNLAQPKKSHVNEELQSKNRKNFVNNRLQKQVVTNTLQEKDTGSTGFRSRHKKEPDAINTILKLANTTIMSLEKSTINSLSASNSPSRNYSPTRLRTVSPIKISNAVDKAENLKKMVAVESYVKNHFGRQPIPCTFTETNTLARSRAPLIPVDIVLSTTSSFPLSEESTFMGKELHHMIDSIITKTVSPLTAVTENRLGEIIESVPKREVLSRSDFAVDIFQDKNIITAVSSITKKEKASENKQNTYVRTANSMSELEVLESALSRQITNGGFQKKLRIKNLTLTPKHSLQQTLVLQSGDAGSLVVKSTILQKKHSSDNIITELNAMPVFSNGQFNVKFANFPMQLTTVGYSFPAFQIDECSSVPKLESYCGTEHAKLSAKVRKETKQIPTTSSKTIQFYNGDETDLIIKNFNPVSENTIIICKKESNMNSLPNIRETSEVKPKMVEINNALSELSSAILSEPFVNLDSDVLDKDVNGIKAETEINPVKTISENIDNSNSLDILVGLLNEIRKITTYPADMPKLDCLNQDGMDIRTLLSNTALIDVSINQSPHALISISSLDKLRHLESKSSIYSFHLSSNEGDKENYIEMAREKPNLMPIKIDKEVHVDFCNKEYVHRFTDVPSSFTITTMAVNHNVNVAGLIVDDIVIDSCTESTDLCSDYETIYTDSTFDIVETSNTDNKKSCITMNIKKSKTIKPIEQNVQIVPDLTGIGHHFKNSINRNTIDDKKTNWLNRNIASSSPTKFKRDVLVTFYFILVISTFVALTLPEIAYKA